jgi:hypothetical protein
LSVRSYVFTDDAMKKRASLFVWLAIDTENDDTAAFMKQYPSNVLPTFWVIDSATEKPSLKWNGSATVSELGSMLDDAVFAIYNGNTGGEAGAELVRGNQETAAGHGESAVKAYRAALAAAPAGWTKRGEVIDALTERLSELHRYDECVDLALAELPNMTPGTTLSDTAQTALGAADRMPENAPGRAEKIAQLIDEVRELASDTTLPILADDRSSLYDTLVDALADSDPAASKQAAKDWAAFLEDQAAHAPNAEARAVFDAHRLTAYIALGADVVAQKAVPMLQMSEQDFPKDYNPPARLARAYLETKQLDLAEKEIERALSMAYGGRKLRVYITKADIAKARGDAAAEKQTLNDAIADAKTMQLGGGYGRLVDSIQKRLDAIK